jgi:hypothetical protein
MADLIQTKIPNLSDDELFECFRNHSKYNLETGELAIAELRRRGHIVPENECESIRIQAGLRISDIGNPDSSNSIESSARAHLSLRSLRAIVGSILLIGFGSSVFIYLFAKPEPDNPLGYDPLQNKMYIHELQVYGGNLNVMAAEFQQWFASLWYGKSLAYTIACITLFLAIVIWYIGSLQATDTNPAPEDDNKNV